VHVLEAKDDLRRVEPHLLLGEDTVLGEVIVQVTAVHQVEDKAALLGCLERVSHAHDERTALLVTDK